MVFLFLAIYVSGCTTPDVDTIKIGAVLPLTGDGTPDQGQASQKAITLAIDEINSQGGVNGKHLEAIFEDSQCQAQKGVTAITKLIDIDNAGIVYYPRFSGRSNPPLNGNWIDYYCHY